ncbi:hypothetical protein DPMN_078355 [Dreissena polymorpha]|uniref:Uncharacterized protein n=1 Tax=Dreissena polymorpha TaxID=45954 RepID=A0A9D4BQF3_DREPO|nr:hypothetical protein DPMN_078355 [Dreissena polymorpha]
MSLCSKQRLLILIRFAISVTEKLARLIDQHTCSRNMPKHDMLSAHKHSQDYVHDQTPPLQ